MYKIVKADLDKADFDDSIEEEDDTVEADDDTWKLTMKLKLTMIRRRR